jgi:hypothetical protein
MIGLPRFIARRTLHRWILAYVDSCGGVLHSRPYGKARRYLVAMNEGEYSSWTAQPRIMLFKAIDKHRGGAWRQSR